MLTPNSSRCGVIASALCFLCSLVIPNAAFGSYYAYITNTGGSTVSVVDTANDTIVAMIPTELGPYAAAVNRVGSRVYVACTFSTKMTVINAHTRTVIANVEVGSNARGVAVSPDGTRVYVAVTGTNSVAVVDTATNSVLTTIQGVIGSHSLIVSPDGRRVYVANNVGYQTGVTVIETQTNTITGTINVGSAPVDVAL